MIKFFQERPWIWVVIAFVILITGWVFLLRIANERRPESVEIHQPPAPLDNVSKP